ncbi:hypothetical protein CEP53_007894 [Fusarium sp. AF-6]|nr:hypothetical protein CEP53_007894 [Fusarium sp. AF-6]
MGQVKGELAAEEIDKLKADIDEFKAENDGLHADIVGVDSQSQISASDLEMAANEIKSQILAGLLPKILSLKTTLAREFTHGGNALRDIQSRIDKWKDQEREIGQSKANLKTKADKGKALQELVPTPTLSLATPRYLTKKPIPDGEFPPFESPIIPRSTGPSTTFAEYMRETRRVNENGTSIKNKTSAENKTSAKHTTQRGGTPLKRTRISYL